MLHTMHVYILLPAKLLIQNLKDKYYMLLKGFPNLKGSNRFRSQSFFGRERIKYFLTEKLQIICVS